MSDTNDKGRALLSALLIDSIAASFRTPSGASAESFNRFRRTFNRVFGDEDRLPSARELSSLHSRLVERDLDRLGQRAAIQLDKPEDGPNNQTVDAWNELVEAFPEFEALTNLDELLNSEPRAKRKAWSLFFSTRPLGVTELNLLIPKTQSSLEKLCQWLRHLRGSRQRPVTNSPSNDGNTIVVNWADAPEKPLVAITSFETSLDCWNKSVCGKPDVSFARFEKLFSLLRTTCKLRPLPHYLVFPELSIPRRWVIEAASVIQRSGISLIAGVEYEIDRRRGLCHNPGFMILRSTDLQHPTYRLIRQDKVAPALEEEHELHSISKLVLRPKRPFDRGWSSTPQQPRPIYRHGDFNFGLMICNELTDISMRQQYRGSVDALFLLEWNRDIRTFGALVEATAGDVHCFVVQVNNRCYGDSRIRVPASEEWRRDVVRLQGGVNDYVVIGAVDYIPLREFQSRHRSPSGDGALFKPVPTGFRISAARTMNDVIQGDA